MKPVARFLLCIVIVFFFYIFPINLYQFPSVSTNINMEASQNKNDAYHINGPLTLTVILEKNYLDGEISEEVVNETIWSMEDFWETYAEWQLVQQDDEQVVFKKAINDISPLSKANGYFGVTKNGTLTIFEGKPAKSSKIIQSFYQIDLGKLESRKQKLLKEGIPVQSKEHFNKVIETFKPYSSTTKK